MRDQPFCFWHSPEHAADAQQARRLGGLRRRRESAVTGAYELDDPVSVEGMRRLLEIAISDTLALENSLDRNRALISATHAGVRIVGLADINERLAAIEAVVHAGKRSP